MFGYQMFGHLYEVLNKIYLQFFFAMMGCNREMNLTSLLNP